MTTQYVLGFAFDDLGRVALVRKNRPDWQRGKLNGIGGGIEEGEDPNAAMSREFFEEAGVTVPYDSWRWVGTMNGDDWSVWVYTVTSPLIRDARTTTDETVHLIVARNVHLSRHLCIANVPALIELCLIPPEPPSNVSPAFALRY